MATIVVATSGGVRPFASDGDSGATELEGRSVSALGRGGDDLWAIVEATELWRRAAGRGWSRVASLAGHHATCVAAIGSDVYVGSSEARLFRLDGARLEPVAAFDDVDGRDGWFTPWGGPPDTRSIANWDEDVYVNVHVGGIPRTSDGGGSWTPTIDVDADVHQVTTAPGLVLAACALGLASSSDGGASWTYRTEGLEARYARAVAVCGDAVLVTTSHGPRGGRAAVSRGDLGGGPLERSHQGLPPWFEDNIDTAWLDALPDGSFAAFGTSEGDLYGSTDQGATWSPLATGIAGIRRVLVLP
jgi:hypothetical protein